MGLRPRVVCFEGNVGSGKTTQLELLRNRLGSICYLLPELNDIPPMKEVRDELRSSGRISDLSEADVRRLATARGEIHSRLLRERSEKIVLMDRGIYTGMVYERGPLSMWDVETVSRESGVLVPDLCFLLHCSAEVALSRVDERRARVGKYEHRAFHETEEYINWTRDCYFEIAAKRLLIEIETSVTRAQAHEKIMEKIYDAGIL